MEVQPGHVVISISPNARPINTIYLQRQKRSRMSKICFCSCSKMNQLCDKYNRLEKRQKFYVFLCLFVLLAFLGAFIFALYIGIKICILAC